MDTHQGVHVMDTHKSVQEMDAYIINFLQKNKSLLEKPFLLGTIFAQQLVCQKSFVSEMKIWFFSD